VQHVVLFLAMTCLGLGLVSLTRSFVSYQRNHLRFQKTLTIALAILLGHLAPSFVFGYLETNAGSLLAGAPWRALGLVHTLEIPLMLALIAFVMTRLFLTLQRESWSRLWLALYWGAALLPATYYLLDAATLLTMSDRLRSRLSATAFVVSLLVPYGSLIVVAWRAQARSFAHLSPLQARHLRLFGRTVLALVAFTFVVDLGNAFVTTGTGAGSVLSILPATLVFAACLLFIDPFIAVMFPREGTSRNLEDHFLLVIERYGISKREKQVLQLICLGKTNKQIAKALLISLPTVKDHISNIFRKTGVTNRVQLAALFHFGQGQ
jgi:DNA-binding CsgD family transcriptional regulator